MTEPLVLPKASHRGGFHHPGCLILPALGVNATGALPAIVVAFFYVYDSDDTVGWGQGSVLATSSFTTCIVLTLALFGLAAAFLWAADSIRRGWW